VRSSGEIIILQRKQAEVKRVLILVGIEFTGTRQRGERRGEFALACERERQIVQYLWPGRPADHVLLQVLLEFAEKFSALSGWLRRK